MCLRAVVKLHQPDLNKIITTQYKIHMKLFYIAKPKALTSNICLYIVPDTQGPTFIYIPDDITITTDDTDSTIEVSWTDPIAVDGSGEVTLFSSHEPGDRFVVGTTTLVTYTAIDCNDNEMSGEFYVTVGT